MIKNYLIALTLLCLTSASSFAQSIVAVNPDTVVRNQTLVLSITGQGTNFYQSTQASQATGTSWLTRGFNAILPSITTVQSPTQMTSIYTIPGNADFGWWALHVMDISGELILQNGVFVDMGVVNDRVGPNIQESISISPNPILDRFSLQYTLPDWADVEVMVMDLQGRNVRSLLKSHEGPGVHESEFNVYGLALASETFLIVLRVDDRVFATKAMLMR
jgi:hypothetical protein